MAHPVSSSDRQKIITAVTWAYRCASDGASSDAVLCSDDMRTKFDSYVRTLCTVYGVSVTPEEARRKLLALRKAGALGPSAIA